MKAEIKFHCIFPLCWRLCVNFRKTSCVFCLKKRLKSAIKQPNFYVKFIIFRLKFKHSEMYAAVKKGKYDKFVPDHALEVYRRSRYVVPVVLKLGCSWK
jgi:hypothetical protein